LLKELRQSADDAGLGARSILAVVSWSKLLYVSDSELSVRRSLDGAAVGCRYLRRNFNRCFRLLWEIDPSYGSAPCASRERREFVAESASLIAKKRHVTSLRFRGLGRYREVVRLDVRPHDIATDDLVPIRDEHSAVGEPDEYRLCGLASRVEVSL
jgi:hypothetical protein